MKYAIRTIIFLSLAYGSWVKFSRYFNNNDITVLVEADGQLSEQARGIIKVYVQDLLKKTLCLADIATAVKQSFGYIQTVALSKKPSDSLHLALGVVKPIALCNQEFAVCSNDRLFEKELFDNALLKQVPDYYVPSHQLAHFDIRSFKQFVTTCDARLASEYRITWHNAQKIHMQDKAHPAIVLVANQAMISTMPNVQLAYNTVKDSLVERLQNTPEKKRTKLAWYVDGRFKNQMVVIPKGVVG